MKAFWVLPAAMVLMACNAGEPATAPQASAPTYGRVSSDAVPSAPAARPSATAAPKPTKKPAAAPDLDAGLDQQEARRPQPRLGRLLADYGAYKRYMITYRGDGLTIRAS